MHTTPLKNFHDQHGPKYVDFAGWEMPLYYSGDAGGGIIAEHNRVRNAGGIFDVSHMGRVTIKGRHARRLLERICSRRISDMVQGQCRYSFVCNERGGIKDDVLVYRKDDDEFLVVVNASNREKLVAHFEQVCADGEFKASIDDRTLKTAMLAFQGPKVMDMIGKVSSEIPTLKRYRFTEKNFLVMKLLVSRTGYTGENGVEVILPAGMVEMALKLLMKDVAKPGSDDAGGIGVAGLGARDTLRMEAGMPLYGNELGEDISAHACGMGFAMNLDKGDDEKGEPFIGMDALIAEQEAGGPARVLVGLFVDGKRSARGHMKVMQGGAEVGEVTSACASPTLGRCIAMAYVDRAHSEVGTALQIDTGRDSMLEAEVTALPFYKAPKP